MKTGPLLFKILDLPISMDSCIVHCFRFVHDIGGKCYLLLEGLVREEPQEVMADEVEFSNQAAGVSDIQNFFSKVLVFDAISKTSF